MLFFQYKGKCIRCHNEEYFYLLEDNILGGEVECKKCQYKGMIDLKCLGRIDKKIKGVLINPDIVDPT